MKKLFALSVLILCSSSQGAMNKNLNNNEIVEPICSMQKGPLLRDYLNKVKNSPEICEDKACLQVLMKDSPKSNAIFILAYINSTKSQEMMKELFKDQEWRTVGEKVLFLSIIEKAGHDVIKTLIAAGIDVNIRCPLFDKEDTTDSRYLSFQGKTLMKIMRETGDFVFAGELLKLGAKPESLDFILG